MKVLFRDKDIIVCIKPAGALSTDEAGGMPELIRQEIGQDQVVRTVHRLDSVVGGLMVYALSQEAASGLSAQIADGSFVKEYFASLEGQPERKQGELRDYLRRDKVKRKTYAVRRKERDAQEAILHYKVCASTRENSLVKVRLVTGRTHQIRAQFSSRKLPLYGDGKYGSRHREADIALWSCHLSFHHPVTGRKMDFEAMPPAKDPWLFFPGYHAKYETQDVIMAFKRSRNLSDCPYAEACGLCDYQGLDYEKQLEKKQKLAARSLKSFGEILPIIGMEKPFAYRHKVTYGFSMNKRGELVSGLYSRRGRKLVQVRQCLVNHPKAEVIAKTICELAGQYQLQAFDEAKKTGWLKEAQIWISRDETRVMVMLETSECGLDSEDAFMKALREKHPEIESIFGGSRSRGLKCFYGRGEMTEEICGHTIQMTLKSAFPVNPAQLERICHTAVSLAQLSDDDRVLNAFSGNGLLAMTVAKKVKKVLAVDHSRNAIADAGRSAKENHIENIRFTCAEPEEYIEALARSHEQMDVVFLEPSGKGCAEKCVTSIAKLKPDKIVYVSGNPETLASDLTIFTKKGYRVETLQPIDLYPYEKHVALCCLLMKAD